MIYTVPWAPVIALATVLLLFMVVPLVAFVALAMMLLILLMACVAALTVAAVTVPPLVFGALRTQMSRLHLSKPRLRVRLPRPAPSGDPRLERLR